MARSMKDSGIEWIGKIPVDWKLHRMKSCVASRVIGAWGNEPAGDENDVICMRIADFDYSRFRFKDTPQEELTKRNYDSEIIEKLMLKSGDILLEKSGGGEKTPVGRSVIFDKNYPALYANFMERIRCSDFVSYRWMQFAFITFYKNEYSRNYIKQTTGIQNLDITSLLCNERLPVPSIEEQTRIADFLDEKCAGIDAVIEKTRASIEDYKKLKQSVITQAVTKGIRPNRPLKPSGIDWIGEIPEDWGRDKIIRIFKTVGSGTTPKSDNENYYEGNIHWIQSGDINGGILNDSKSSVNESAIEKFSALKIYKAPFLIMAMYGASIGNLSVSNIDGCVNQACCVMQNGCQDLRYSFYALKTVKDYLIWKAVGGGQPNISQETIKQLWLPMPGKEEQKEIANYLDQKITEMDSLIVRKEQFISEIESYKKSLIYEYVTGKKEISV